ncbi:MAG: VWA domain-containing protein [Isosphaeraceae bacterium]|nr:VWA domain-containing protein [Isosphaeraceae bacterium]
MTVFLTVLFLLTGISSLALAVDGPRDDDIKRAITEGVRFLREQQEPDGNWTYSFNHNHTLGITALAGLALLENGVARDDPAIRQANKVVRALAIRSNQTYDLTLAILFLARVQAGARGPNDRLIRRLGWRLARGEQGGMWTYTVPLESDEDYEHQYPEEEETGSQRRTDPGNQREGGAGASLRKKAARPNRSRRALKRGDNSNTQFALLGIWAAGRHGFDSEAALEALDEHFRETQGRDGGWGYKPSNRSSEAMSCAGLMALAIAAARPEEAARLNARARGAKLAADPAFTQALQLVGEDARTIGPRSDIYYLWSLERVCVALGLHELDGLDWYATGARELLRRQQADGSWPRGRWGTLPNTCLALLFLRKANLAFELDRVLKLPSKDRDQPAEGSPPAPEPQSEGTTQGAEDVRVIVRSADEKRFPEITLDFEVKRPDGSPVLDAKPEDFRVTEYDQPVEILKFQGPQSKEVRPTTVVLVVDKSLSMEEEDRIGGLKAAVATFLKVMPPRSRVAVVAFSSDVKILCPFTDNPAQVLGPVNALSPEGATRYYDAVAEALELIAQEPGRRAVLALTDGEDTFSQSANLDSVILAARREGVPVYTLGLGSEDEIESDALRRLARETRGQYFPARQADQLRQIYEEVARGLGSSYSLVYRTNRRLPDGTLRPVRVYYLPSRSASAGEAAVYVRGMVVPAPGWSRLFLLLLAILATLAALPGWLARRSRAA